VYTVIVSMASCTKCFCEDTCRYRLHVALRLTFCDYIKLADIFATKKINSGLHKIKINNVVNYLSLTFR